MLHPAKREFGDQDEIVLREREFVVEIGFEVFDGFAFEAKLLEHAA